MEVPVAAEASQPVYVTDDPFTLPGNDMLSDMLGLHDLVDFGFGQLDGDLSVWRT